MDLVNGWLSQQINPQTNDAARLNKAAEAWDNVNRAARDVDSYNLERKPLVFSVFGELAKAAR